MMRTKILFILGIAIMGLGGCGRYNSEFATPNFNGLKILKPTCDFQPDQTCWMEDLAVIRECAENTKSQGVDFFTNDFRSCDNYRGKKVLFGSETYKKLKRLKNSKRRTFPGNLSFIMYSKEPSCFQFEGSENDFVIEMDVDEPSYRRLAYKKMSNGDIRIQCFSGEVMKITAENIESGCSNTSLKKESFLPKVQFRRQFERGEASWSLRFFGVGDVNPFQVFQCY